MVSKFSYLYITFKGLLCVVVESEVPLLFTYFSCDITLSIHRPIHLKFGHNLEEITYFSSRTIGHIWHAVKIVRMFLCSTDKESIPNYDV